MRIGVVGGGFVGSATALLTCPDIEVIVYDLDPARCKPVGTSIHDLISCEIVFVCVPTPTHADGSCNTRIVERCIRDLKAAGVTNIVLRSTVPPGTSSSLSVDFMPEFLTEANWRTDFYNCGLWVFGTTESVIQEKLQTMIQTAHSNGVIKSSATLFVRREEAELIKYTRNNFLALKISFFNEIASLCKRLNLDYDNIRAGVTADARIGTSHTVVPGPDGHAGFGGTCLPKDTSALESFMKSQGVESPVISGMVYRNRVIDRPEHDWEADPRAFTLDKQ